MKGDGDATKPQSASTRQICQKLQIKPLMNAEGCGGWGKLADGSVSKAAMTALALGLGSDGIPPLPSIDVVVALPRRRR